MKKKLSPLRVLKDIASRTKGWPVGVPSSDNAIAEQLRASGHLRYAPPAYNYPTNPSTYGLTTLGTLVVEGRIKL